MAWSEQAQHKHFHVLRFHIGWLHFGKCDGCWHWNVLWRKP